MRPRLSRAVTTIAVALFVTGAAGASAADHSVRVMTKYRVTSNEVVGDQRFLTLVGTGHSPQLGSFEITSSAVAAPAGGGCQSRDATETWTTSSGSLEIETQGLLCGNGKISGTWSVAGGSGVFANAAGSGTMRGELVAQGMSVNVAYTGGISR